MWRSSPHTARTSSRFIGESGLLNELAAFVPKPIWLQHKGVRGRQARTKARCGGRNACGQLSTNTEFGLGRKRTPDLEITEHSSRTQLSYPPASCFPSVSSTACLSLTPLWPEVLILPQTAAVCLSVCSKPIGATEQWKHSIIINANMEDTVIINTLKVKRGVNSTVVERQ